MCRKVELTPGEERKRRKGICIEWGCSKKAKGAPRCAACHRRIWAENNPEKYLYANLRGNARRRGKVFEITFEEFSAFLKKENYLRRKRGRTKTSVSVDRDRNELGYVAGNLKAVTLSDNSWKRNYVDYFRRLEQNYCSPD